MSVEPADRRERIELYLREQVAHVLRISASELDVQQPLKTAGLDSLMAIELKNLVEQNLAVEIPAARLLEGPNIAQLADVLAPQLGAAKVATELASVVSDSSSNPWISYWQPQSEPHLRLFCFHFLGGGASAFGDWQAALGPEIEVCPVQLPGREERLQDPLVEDMPALCATLCRELMPWLDRPFAIYGHSMGALIGFALAQELRKQGRKPAHFFAAGYFAPDAPNPFETREDLHAEGLSAAVRRMIDAPEAVLNNAEFMQALLPIIQADSRLVGSYVHGQSVPLDCPITALGGIHDEEVAREDLQQWERHTSADFRLVMFAGKHLFLLSHLEPLLATIREDLQRVLAEEAQAVS